MMQGAKTGAVTLKGHKGIGMEGFIATWYARQTAKDIDEFKSTAQRFAAYIKPGDRVLEIAPGPGYLAIELQKLTRCRMIGVDISNSFVRIATENAEKAGVDICFDHGDAADLQLPANVFDFALCRAAFKNFTRPLAAIDEMHRVLKPGGTAVIMDLRKDFLPREVDDYVRDKDKVSAVLIKVIFHTMLKRRAYTREGIERLASQSQFQQGEVRLVPLGFELWLHKPH
jgi:ubiquinone/menaquinone biosynthesis C-methylase UbiE